MIHLILSLHEPTEKPEYNERDRRIRIFWKNGDIETVWVISKTQFTGCNWDNVRGWQYADEIVQKIANPRAPGDVFEARCKRCKELVIICESTINCYGDIEIVPRADDAA